MDAISPSVWFPVVTLVIGVLLKALFDAWTENRRSALDKLLRVEKRKEIILLQRIDLQRKALGDLQIALTDMMRGTAVTHLADVKSLGQTGEWGAIQPSDVGDASRAAFREVTIMKVRVRDERVRSLVDEIASLCSAVGYAQTFEEAEEAFFLAGSLYTGVNEAIGESLRALENDEQALFA